MIQPVTLQPNVKKCIKNIDIFTSFSLSDLQCLFRDPLMVDPRGFGDPDLLPGHPGLVQHIL